MKTKQILVLLFFITLIVGSLLIYFAPIVACPNNAEKKNKCTLYQYYFPHISLRELLAPNH